MNNWQTKKLGEVADILMGQSPPSSTYNSIGKGLPFFQGKKDFNDLYPTISGYCSKPARVAKKDDVLLSVRAPVGPVNLAPSEICIGRGLSAIKGKQNILNQMFLFYFMKLNEFSLAKKGTGSTFSSINRKDIENIDIPLPSFSIQQQIVDKLDAIRKLQEINQKEIEKVEELFNSFFNSIFSLINKWEVKKISDIAVINPPKPKFHDWDLEKEVDFLPMSALATDAQNPFTAEKRKLKQVIKGYTCFQSDDVLLAKITPCFENGKTGIFRKNPKSVGFGSTEFIVIRADDKKVQPLWIWLFIFSNKFRQEGKLHMTGTAGQKRLPTSFVENYQIPVPPLNMQQQIIEKFQNIASLFELKKKEKEALNELFESTLNKVMRGELLN